MPNKIPEGHAQLIVSIPAEMKADLKLEAAATGKTLNQLVTEKLEKTRRYIRLMECEHQHIWTGDKCALCGMTAEEDAAQLKKEA